MPLFLFHNCKRLVHPQQAVLLLCTTSVRPVDVFAGRPSQWLSSVVQHIGYSAQLKYLLVVLQPRFGGKQLAAVKPDVAAMGEAVPASEVTGVIVAAASAPGATGSMLIVECLDCLRSNPA
jgi:hypothetical protein